MKLKFKNKKYFVGINDAKFCISFGLWFGYRFIRMGRGKSNWPKSTKLQDLYTNYEGIKDIEYWDVKFKDGIK